jgi:diguanylate cyclase (GGDEF)-like protein
MKRKAVDKLFSIVYTDSMTGALNRNAYEEQMEKLKKNNARLDDVTVIAIKLDDLNEIKYTMGNRTGDEAIKLAARCIIKTMGEKADIYRIDEDEFLCITQNGVASCIKELRDVVSFEGRSKKYPFSLLISYMQFDNKRHISIDELVKDCDQQLMRSRRRLAT